MYFLCFFKVLFIFAIQVYAEKAEV